MTQEPAATNPIVARIDEAIKAQGGSREQVSKDAQLYRGYLRKIALRPDAIPRANTLMRLADAAKIPQQDLLDIAKNVDLAAWGEQSVAILEAKWPRAPAAASENVPMVPIVGIAEGSILSSITPSESCLGYAARPPGLIGVQDAYAIYITGDSMSPRHKSGELRFVHPLRRIKSGDDVIIQTINGQQEPEVFIKTYERQSSEWYHCRQLNPDAEVRYARSRVKSIHKIMTLNELFNL